MDLKHHLAWRTTTDRVSGPSSGRERLATTSVEGRIRSRVSVRLFGMDARNKPFTTMAQTINVGMSGARVAGVDVPLMVNEVIGLQYGGRKARFRVVTVGAPGTPKAGELELDCLQPGNDIWNGVEESAPEQPSVAAEQQPLPEAPADFAQIAGDRRRFQRYTCDIGAAIQGDNGTRVWARCTDISRGGCYLETMSPMPVGATLTLLLEEIESKATVTTSHPGVGMGLKFLSAKAPQALETLIARFIVDEDRSERKAPADRMA